MKRPPLNVSWQGKCVRFNTCAMKRYDEVEVCNKAKPGCECMRKLCRDRLYFDLRDSSNRQTGIGGVITSHSSRFDLRVVLPTQAQAKAEMDASGVRGITLFDAPPDMQEDSLHSGSEHSKGTWLGILRAKGRREREIVESDDPNLISFRMRSGPHGNHRDSFETHPPVEAGGRRLFCSWQSWCSLY